MKMLSLEDGKILVESAREAITGHLAGRNLEHPHRPKEALGVPHGVFVTLLDTTKNRELRGCIGNPFSTKSVLDETIHCAVVAATEDPRFPPVNRDEFDRNIIVEVTILSPIEEIVVKSPLDLPLNLKVGRDGLFVSGLGARGLLLPQVAVDEGFDEEEFLSECCLKAGLMPDAWVAGNVSVARFQGQIFSEDEPSGSVEERTLRGRGRKG
jgi:uncharacterized protein (TIGR00296 family)